MLSWTVTDLLRTEGAGRANSTLLTGWSESQIASSQWMRSRSVRHAPDLAERRRNGFTFFSASRLASRFSVRYLFVVLILE